MKCDECLKLLELYLDRELDRDARSQFIEHLTTCENCLAAYRRLENEAAFLAEHAPAIDPSPAFWSRVSQQVQGVNDNIISSKETGSFGSFFRQLGGIRIGPVLTASIVICSIALTGLVMHFTNRRNVTNPATAATQVETLAAKTALAAPESLLHSQTDRPKAVSKRTTRVSAAVREDASPEQLVRDAERKYLAAIAILSRDAVRKRSRSDPEQLMQFDQALNAVDRTIAGTRRAVRQHPRDPVAVQYMLTAYAKKVDVLRQMLSD